MLSKAEQPVADYVRAGLSNKEIADRLFVSEKTIKFHIGNIYKKLNVKSRSHFIAEHQGNYKRGEFMEQRSAEVYLPNQQDKRNTGIVVKSQEDKILFIDAKFKIGDTISHLHSLMKDVTKQELNPNTVNAACNCVARLNETINTAIQAARFLNDR